MSNQRDNVSERNIDANRPSTAQVSTSTQPFQPKNSHSNKIKEKNHVKRAPKNSPKHNSKNNSKEKSHDPNIEGITAQCQNVSIHNESSEPMPPTPHSSRGKNAKKKEKRLNIPPPQQSIWLPQETPPEMYNLQSVEELLRTQIAPLYAQQGSRQTENTQGSHSVHLDSSRTPQFERSASYTTTSATSSVSNTPAMLYSPNIPMPSSSQAIPIGTSAPNSPYGMNVAHLPFHMLQRPMSVPGTPLPKMDGNTRYLQNMLQHPLLNQSLPKNMQMDRRSMNCNRNENNCETHRGQSKKRTEHNSKAKKEVTSFEKYMPKALVEEGLKNKTLIEGVIRINPKQFQQAYVSSSSDRSEQDILLDGIRNRNRSLEGDIVVVQLIESDSEPSEEDTTNEKQHNNENTKKDENDKQKKGKVVYIKEQVHNRTCIGNLKLMPDKNRLRALFVPRDHRIPRLNILNTFWPDNFYKQSERYENTLFLAKILHWTDTRFALGKIECNIGQSGDILTETKAILAETCLDITPFGPEVRHLYPRLDYVIPPEEIEIREDCRKLCIFSIDPHNCRDIDDAISCKELENGNYEIGVHISDVAHFLTEGTILDEKVSDKATTIYMVERAYHMLPDELCMLCSLFPAVDKLAFSVFWEITKDAEVVSHRFAKTVIHSCAQLAYEHAQGILEDKDDTKENFPDIHNGYAFEDVKKVIKVIGSIAATFRKNRFEGGALRIDQPKISFTLRPEDGLPETFHIYQNQESHQLIEEFMLLANMTVAHRIHEDHHKLAFLRCHPPPSGYMLKQLAKSLKPMGIDLDVSSAGSLHCSLLPYVGLDCEDHGRAMVLNMLCAKPMARAKYFCAGGCHDEDFSHYALNVPLYTHFTSPIRRYADIMVHRLLAASLNYTEMPQWEVDNVRKIAAQCNKQKYNAKKAGEMSTDLYTLKYIEMNSPVITEAVVVEVRDKYIDVVIIAMGLNRRIYFNDFSGEFKRIRHEDGERLSTMELKWRAEQGQPETLQRVNVFSIVQVQLYKCDDMVKVETKLVRPTA